MMIQTTRVSVTGTIHFNLPEAAPFVKWAGGKRQLLPELRKHVPKKFGRYFEPFVGGAALYYDLKPHRAILNDLNAELINCYRVVRDNVELLIKSLGRYRYNEKMYYAVRAREPTADIAGAARTIYLNRTGFNGMYRVNKAGKFNIPFGDYTNPTICDAANLRACSAVMGYLKVKLMSVDFEDAVESAKRGDLVYFDPPYVPKGGYADFTSYTADGFGQAEQERLRDVALRLKKSGVHVILSNHDLPLVRRLYKGFEVRRVLAKRNINSKVENRGPVGEVIIT